jgi:hypothetical protein
MPTLSEHISFSNEMSHYIDNGIVKDIALEPAIQWMQQNLEPEDIFSEKQLSNWAEAAGWVKP